MIYIEISLHTHTHTRACARRFIVLFFEKKCPRFIASEGKKII